MEWVRWGGVAILFYSLESLPCINFGCWDRWVLWIWKWFAIIVADCVVLLVSLVISDYVLVWCMWFGNIFALMPDEDRSSSGILPMPMAKIGLCRGSGFLAWRLTPWCLRIDRSSSRVGTLVPRRSFCTHELLAMGGGGFSLSWVAHRMVWLCC